MPPPETFERHDRAVLLEFAGVDSYGEIVRRAPVELTVRWETADVFLPGGRREVRDPQGNTIALDALVVVAREIPVDSLMWKGTLEEWVGSGTGTGSDSPTSELMIVKWYSEIPDLKGRHVRRLVGLMKYRSEVPEAE